jgi:hypothetical protein
MVAGRGADHAALQCRRRQMGHLVIGAAQLEGKYALHIFAFQQHGVAQALR